MSVKHLGYAASIAVAAIGLAIGSAASSQAKAKKDMNDMAGPPPYICNWLYKPVCAVMGGEKRTYSSACWAAKDGAKILYAGECKSKKPTKKPAMKKKSKKK